MRAEGNNGHNSREPRKYPKTGQSKAQYSGEMAVRSTTPWQVLRASRDYIPGRMDGCPAVSFIQESSQFVWLVHLTSPESAKSFQKRYPLKSLKTVSAGTCIRVQVWIDAWGHRPIYLPIY